MKFIKMLFNPGDHCWGTSIGLLVLRVALGLMMFWGHGLGKLSTFMEQHDRFPDPLGIGSTWAMAGATFAEGICSLLIVLGLGTRVAAIPLVFTMCVAGFIVHGDDPWGRKELAFMYAAPFFALMFIGAGRLSLDALICKDRGFGGKNK